MSTNQETENVFDSVVSSVYYRYYVSDWYWIQEPTVDATIAQWSCSSTSPSAFALYSPLQPPTPPLPPLPLAPLLPPFGRRPLPSRPQPVARLRHRAALFPVSDHHIVTYHSPVPNCVVDVLFLVDESLSMIKDGYDQSLAYVQSIAQQISQQNNASSFSIITFNSIVVYQSPVCLFFSIQWST